MYNTILPLIVTEPRKKNVLPSPKSSMLAEEFVADLRRRLDRLHKCRYHWKQYMIIRGILLQYNRFTRQYPYHKYILPIVVTQAPDVLGLREVLVCPDRSFI